MRASRIEMIENRKYVRNKFQETNFVINYAGSETREEGVGIRLWGYNFF